MWVNRSLKSSEKILGPLRRTHRATLLLEPTDESSIDLCNTTIASDTYYYRNVNDELQRHLKCEPTSYLTCYYLLLYVCNQVVIFCDIVNNFNHWVIVSKIYYCKQHYVSSNCFKDILFRFTSCRDFFLFFLRAFLHLIWSDILIKSNKYISTMNIYLDAFALDLMSQHRKYER